MIKPLGVVLMAVSALNAFQAFTFPAPAGQRNILPSSVCFVMDGQIHRLSRNGESLERLTGETLPIEDFDVSPVNGDIAFVSGNALVLLDGDGVRRVLVEGAVLPSAGSGVAPHNDTARITGRIASPRWSPDGASIAFVHNGLMMVNPSDSSVTVLHPNGDPLASGGSGGCRIISGVDSWSPDGVRLLVTCYDYPLESIYGVSMALKEMGGSLTILQEGIGTPGWKSDGQVLYIAYPRSGGRQSFCRLDAPEWSCTQIGEEVPSRSYYFYGYPNVAPDGSVQVLIASGADPMASDGSFTLYRVNAGGEGAAIIRIDSYTLSEALWSRTGNGLLIESSDGRLFWVPAGESAAVLLPVTGASLLRWDAAGR